MTEPLFRPIPIRRLEVKNRICMPAMHLRTAEGFPVTDRIVNFSAERARGGAGPICVRFATRESGCGSAWR
jgi:2,4-dienoyl-CoA reductase (NADPH2)